MDILIELYEIIDVFFVIIGVHDFEGQSRKLFLTNIVFYL
jgi:hypothetical protein